MGSNKPIRTTGTTWRVKRYSWAAARRLATQLRIPPLVATVLAARGMVEVEEARSFLEGAAQVYDPFLFGHMHDAAGRLQEAVRAGRRVVVHGDYDADGITATALMVLGLRQLGVEAEWYLPNRFKEGFGLSRTAVEVIAGGGPATVITVDCGINYPREVELAQTLGLDVVVIDHHKPGPGLPACPVIHPSVGSYPHDDLCGVGLAFKFLHALWVKEREASPTELPEALYEFLDLVALGTIADLAPLRGENRYYVKEGLKLMSIGSRLGLRALAEVSGCAGQIDSGAVAFRLAPRLNAAGRLLDPTPPLRLLLTSDEQEARALAEQLHVLNGERQEVERQILEQAVAQVEDLPEIPPVLVLAGEEWHEGVVGIVAARLVERYYRPAVLLGIRDGVAKGSARSIPGYDLVTGLDACAHLLSVYGGHAQAAGLTLPADQVPAFRETLVAHAAACLTVEDLQPAYQADAILRPEDVTVDTGLALSALGPFGSGNPRPRLLLVGADITSSAPTRNGSHLRCELEVDGVKLRGIGFGLGDMALHLQENGDGKLLGVQLQVEEWEGYQRPRLLLDQVGELDCQACSLGQCFANCPSRLENWQVLPAEYEDLLSEGPGEFDLRRIAAQDWRNQPGRTATLAQVLATGETTVILTAQVAQFVRQWSTAPVIAQLSGQQLRCVGVACAKEPPLPLSDDECLVVEWDALQLFCRYLASAEAEPPIHVVVADPPYRRGHLQAVADLADRSAQLHLHYGDEERRATAKLLRYLVHPRFAMVCLYRAYTKLRGSVAGGAEGHWRAPEVHAEAARLAWQEAGLVLSGQQLAAAAHVLEEVGWQRLQAAGGKIDLKSFPAYAAAEAQYEECVRICLSH